MGYKNQTHNFVFSCLFCFYVSYMINGVKALFVHLQKDQAHIYKKKKLAMPLQFIRTIYMSLSTVPTINMKYFVLLDLLVFVLFISFDRDHQYQR